MKNFIIYGLFIGILGLISLSSCTKDPWVYDTRSKAGIYMLDSRDSNAISFTAITDTNWVSGGCDLYLIGVPTDYDREIKVEVVDSGTNIVEGKDFHIDPVILKAGQTMADMRCWVRMPENAEDEDGKLHFTVQIVENENFIPRICTKAYFAIYVSHQEYAPEWWNVEYMGEFSERAYKRYMTLYIEQESEHTDLWERYLNPVYGTFMCFVKEQWTAEQNRFVPYLKEAVLIPMFDYFTANPYPEVEIPQWYKDLKAENN